MPKIIKHGNTVPDKTVNFECSACGCQWESDNTEFKTYDEDFSLINKISGHRAADPTKIFIVHEMPCPECGDTCKMMRRKYPNAGSTEDR